MYDADMVHKVPVEHPHRGVVADQIGDSGQLGQGGYMVQYTAPAVHRRPEPFQYLPVPVPKGDGTAVQLRQPDLSQLGQRIHGMTVELDLLHLSQYAVPVFFLPVRREQAHSSSQKVKLVLIQKQGWGHIPHLVEHHSGLRETLLKIPAPQFIVFYNGTEKKKDHWLNHLSESFENLSGEPKLELEVLTININEGLNKELMEQCQTLREYAQYVHCVRKYAKELDLNEAVKLAVDECIRNDILSEFLRANKSEVISMSIFEYDKEEEERKLRKTEYEAGVAAGFSDGFNNGFNSGIDTAKKDAAIAFAELHVPVEQIASALQVNVEIAKQWIGNK